MRLIVSNYPGPSALEIEGASFTDRETFDNFIDNICAAADALWGPSFITKEAAEDGGVGELRVEFPRGRTLEESETKPKRRAPLRGRTPERQIAIEACKGAIELAGKPIRTVHLIDELNRRGMGISGSDPVSNLSAMLSQEPGFMNLGRNVGWTYIPPNSVEGDIEVFQDLEKASE